MFDVLIRNGTVVDGTGKSRFTADVGVENGRITLVGQAGDAEAATAIDAAGKIVCPGFVDPHSHADLTLFREDHVRLLEPLVRQGITTFVGGNCGMSLAPIPDKNRDAVENYIQVFTQLDFERDVHWRTMGEFFDLIEQRGLPLNAAILAPHGLLRLGETGPEMRYATAEEVAQEARALEQALDEGAVGMSTGLQYVPGSQSSTEELVALGGVLKRYDAIFTSHLRSYSNTLGRAIDEVREVGEKNDIAVQISHLFWVPDNGVFNPLLNAAIRALAGLSRYWTPPLPLDMPMAAHLDRLARDRERGLRISADAMPTTTGFTHMLAFFPPWALEGSRAQILARMHDREERRKMRRSIEHGRMTWPHTGPDAWTLNLFRLMGYQCARIMAVATPANKPLEGMSLVDIARQRGCHPFDAACDLLLEEDGHVLVFESMAEPEDAFTERSILASMRHPDVALSTDAILMGLGRPSHLFYACYPKFLARFVRDMKLLPLETAIRKITALPAEHFQLEGRGLVAPGAHADLVVFDYEALEPRATFRDPEQFPAGIEHVFVNGRHIVDGTQFNPAPCPGALLRRAS